MQVYLWYFPFDFSPLLVIVVDMDREQELHLIQTIQSGQTDGFSILYDQYFQSLYNHIYYKTTNQELTEDVVSDTFFKAFDKIGSFRIDADALWEKKKELIIMRVRDGLSYEEIADITGRTPVALRKEFSHTMWQLREVCGDLFTIWILIMVIRGGM